MAYQRTSEGRKRNAEYQSRWYKANQEIHKKRVAKNKAEKKERLRQYLYEAKSKPCTDCGQTFHPEVMDFDHVKGMKKFSLSQGKSKSLKLVVEEIAKCELVCANCHRLRTFTRRTQTGIQTVKGGVL
jgi:hypothetical protein